MCFYCAQIKFILDFGSATLILIVIWIIIGKQTNYQIKSENLVAIKSLILEII